MEGVQAASTREEVLSNKRDYPGNQEERSLWIQKRLDHLEEKVKDLKGWSSEKEEEWRKTVRIALQIEYDEGSESHDEVEDDEDLRASKYCDLWNSLLSEMGTLEDTTLVPAMRFTFVPPPPEAKARTTIQVFSAKFVGLSGGLQFPLDVYGTIAARDCADPRRNIIFSRTKDNCQTFTEQDPYLVLTGPSRAIILLDPVYIEVMLKVKGAVESEDKILHFQDIKLVRIDTGYSRMIHRPSTSKLSTLDLALGYVDSSVEGSISVRLTDVSLPAVFFVTARTNNSNTYSRGSGADDIDSKKILLFDSRHTSEPVSPDGYVNLSRSVVSARIKGDLIVCIEALVEHSEENMVCLEMVFPARKQGWCGSWRPYGSGRIEIGVAWSLISY